MFFIPAVGRFPFLQLAILYLLQQKSKQINRSRHFQSVDIEQNTIRQLRLANYPDFPIVEFLSISFTHHIRIIENAKDLEKLDLRRIKNGIGIAHNIEFLPPDLRQIPHGFAPDLRQKNQNACIID